MTKGSRAAALIFAAAGVAGCSLFPSRAPEMLTKHDFGPLRAHVRAHRTPPVILRVKSAPWLSGTAIHYRLLYRDPTAIHVYAQNRWVAPPPALLKARVRWRLGAGPVPGAPAPARIDRLVIVLTRFDQDFTAPDHAFVRLTATARLYNASTGRLVAQKTVDLKRRCAPDARGAVMGLSRLARSASGAFARLVTGRAGAKDRAP